MPTEPTTGAGDLDPADKYMILVSTLSVQVQGVWGFYFLTQADLERLTEFPWKDPNLSYSENKFRMKVLGGLVFSYRRFSTELSLLALAKALEDLLSEAKGLGCSRFDVWQGDDLGLRYHHDMRCIRALVNIIKHSNSHIADNGSRNSRFLIEDCRVKPGLAVEHLGLDIPRYVYRIYWFLTQLAAHLSGVRRPSVPRPETRGFESFKQMIIPAFLEVRTMPGRVLRRYGAKKE